VADDFTRKGSRQGFARAVTSEFRQWLPWIALALLGLGPLLVCALIGPVEAESKLGQKAAPDWSRAIRIGGEMYGIDSGAPLVVGDDGRVHLIWTLRRTPQDYDVRYLRLDQEGLVQEEYDLGLPLYQPRRLRLMMGGDARMHVFLLAFVEQGAKSGLFHFTLTDDGRLNSGPDLLSSATDNCFEFDVAQTSTGTMQVFWTEGAGDRRNMFGLALAPEADAPDEPRMLAQGVAHPVAAGGPGDALYVMWEEPGVDDDTTDLYYMVVTDGYPESLSGQKLMELPTSPRFFRTGPVLTFDQRYAYLVWTVEYRRDSTASVISEGWYASFPLDSPSDVSARAFYLPVEENPVYVSHDSPFEYEHLVPSSGDEETGSERVTYPSALGGHQEALVTCGMTMRRGVSPEHQIINLIFSDGGLLGYQVAGNTTHWSRLSNMVADWDGNLHVSWVEGLEPGPSDVYYATTAQRVKERVDVLTRDDLLFAVLNTVFSSVAALPAVPLALLWVLPPLVWAVVAGRWWVGGEMSSVAGYAAFALAVVVYEVSKLYFSPGLVRYVPFSASIPFLPTELYTPLRVAVPLGIILVATCASVWAIVRTETRSLLTVALVFVLVDAVLTLAVYGPGLALLG
jgi:hypothetical protein